MFLWILLVVVWIHCCHGDFSQYHFTKTAVVPGSLVETLSFFVSKLECSVLCSTQNCEIFTFNPHTGECRKYRDQLQGNSTPLTDLENITLQEHGKPDGHCLRNADCVNIPSAVCDEGICQCPRNFTFIPTQGICSCDCLSLYDAGLTSDGIYEIRPDGVTSVNVSCDMTDGGWTIFQQRIKGDVYFRNATWNQSAEGFGDPKGDYWLGLKYVNMLTWTANEIFFELKLLNDTMVYFHHTDFLVANSSSLFQMQVSQDYKSNLFSPAEYDAFYRHHGKPFSAWDQDNDEDTTKNCAKVSGPWWNIKCGIFGFFNNNFDDMQIRRTPPEKYSVHLAQCRFKIRRQTVIMFNVR